METPTIPTTIEDAPIYGAITTDEVMDALYPDAARLSPGFFAETNANLLRMLGHEIRQLAPDARVLLSYRLPGRAGVHWIPSPIRRAMLDEAAERSGYLLRTLLTTAGVTQECIDESRVAVWEADDISLDRQLAGAALLRDLGLPPALLVWSGDDREASRTAAHLSHAIALKTGRSIHGYLHLDRPTPAIEVERLQRALAVLLDGDPAIQHPRHGMRLPSAIGTDQLSARIQTTIYLDPDATISPAVAISTIEDYVYQVWGVTIEQGHEALSWAHRLTVAARQTDDVALRTRLHEAAERLVAERRLRRGDQRRLRKLLPTQRVQRADGETVEVRRGELAADTLIVTADHAEVTLGQLAEEVRGMGGGGLSVYCPVHSNTNTPAASVFCGRDGRVRLHCHAGCGTFLMTGQEQPTAPKPENPPMHPALSELLERQAMEVGQAIEVTDRYLPPSLLRGLSARSIAIRMPQGTGKTEAMAALPRRGRVLAITHRISLVEELARRFHLASYRDADGIRDDIRPGESVAVTLHSLPRIPLVDETGAPIRYDRIIIDEVTQVLATLLSSTLSDRADEVYSRLVALVGSAERVIVADASLDETAVGWLQRVRGERPTLLYSPQRAAEGWTDYRYSSESQWMGDLEDAVVRRIAAASAPIPPKQTEEVPVVAVHSTSRHMAEALAQRCKDLGARVRLVTSAETRRGEWVTGDRWATEYDVVVYTASMGTGISISSVPAEVWVYAGPRSGSAQDVAQAIRRWRRADHHIHSYVRGGGSDDLLSLGVAGLVEASQQARLLGQHDVYLPQVTRLVSWGGRHYSATPESLEWERVLAEQRNRAMRLGGEGADLRRAIAEEWAAVGMWTVYVPRRPDPRAKEHLQEARQHVSDRRAAAILAAPDITAEQAQALRSRRDILTDDEEAELARYRLRQAYGPTHPLTPQTVLSDLDQLPRRRLAWLVMGLGDERWRAGALADAVRRSSGPSSPQLSSQLDVQVVMVHRLLSCLHIDLLRPSTDPLDPDALREGLALWEQDLEERGTTTLAKSLRLVPTPSDRKKPIQFVGRLLSRLSLSLQRKQLGSGPHRGRRVYTLDVDAISDLLSLGGYQLQSYADQAERLAPPPTGHVDWTLGGPRAEQETLEDHPVKEKKQEKISLREMGVTFSTLTPSLETTPSPITPKTTHLGVHRENALAVA